MEATRLAPAGRACSKFVWQSRFLIKLGGSSVCAFGPPGLCDNHQSRHVDHESPERGGVRRPLVDSMRRNQLARSSNATRIRAAIRILLLKRAQAGWRDSSVHFFVRLGGPRPAQWAGHVVAAFGRHSSRPKCGGRRAAVRRIDTLVWGHGGRSVVRLSGWNSLANSKRSGINSAQRA
jgi:hypothetical protein